MFLTEKEKKLIESTAALCLSFTFTCTFSFIYTLLALSELR